MTIGSDQTMLIVLDHGQQVVLDGILYADRYEQALARLNRDHLGSSHFYYLDVSLDETLRRHATRPQATEFGPDDLRGWYCQRGFHRSTSASSRKPAPSSRQSS